MNTKTSQKLERAAIRALVNSLELPPSLQAKIGKRPKPRLSRRDIYNLVRGIAPVDPVQLRLTKQLSPAERALLGAQSTEFAMSALRGAWQQRFPELSLAELNMKVLAYCTPIRMKQK